MELYSRKITQDFTKGFERQTSITSYRVSIPAMIVCGMAFPFGYSLINAIAGNIDKRVFGEDNKK